jgi:CelD/BcsL family acetyltransferase involved in cellulose biosynthesis
MSDTTDAALEQMRIQLRDLELDHVQLAGRILQLGHDIALLEHGPRRKPGRPRNIAMANPVQANRMEPEEIVA